MDLFVYGTLMVPEVMRRVCGYAGTDEPALLHDFRRRRIRGEVYPAIVACVGEAVGGIVYRGVSDTQLVALDRFEGEMYRREVVTVAVGLRTLPAAAYTLAPGFRHLLSDVPWRLEEFMAEGLGRFLADYPGFFGIPERGPGRDGR